MTEEKGRKGGQNVVTAGVSGVLVGAAVGSAAALTLSKASNRQKIRAKAYQMNDMMHQKAHEMAGKLHKSETKDKVGGGIDTVIEKIKDSENTILDETERAMH